MELFYLIYFSILGVIVGSFYNVVGLRIPENNFFESQRSYCPNCRHTLSWYELIPVFSFLMQQGKCRHCKQPISPLYPFIEMVTGILFALCFYYYGLQPELLTALVFVSLLVIILVTDLTYMLIPDRILLFFLPLFILLRIFIPLDPWWSPLLGAVIGSGLLALIIIVSRGGMGGGDMKLFGVLGIILGWKSVLLAFFLSTLYGAVISGILLLFHLIERKKPVPFGPYIVLGALTAYFFGDYLIDWYVITFIKVGEIDV